MYKHCVWVRYRYLAAQLVEADGVGEGFGAGLHGKGHLSVPQGEPVQQKSYFLLKYESTYIRVFCVSSIAIGQMICTYGLHVLNLHWSVFYFSSFLH